MKYTVGEKKNNEIIVEFTLDEKEWEAEVEQAYQKNKGKYKKEGFRQGKVPRKVLEQTYGEYLFYEDAFNDCCATYYSQMLAKEPAIYPVDYPEVDIKKISNKGVVFTAKITVMPEVTLGQYKGLTIKKEKQTVSADEVKAELDRMLERQARYEEVKDRPAKLGDLINLDYSGSVDGKKFDGGTAKDQELELGSHSFIDGFEDQMVGMKIGEEKDINVTFPENYHSTELAGKKAVFAVKLLAIREKHLPELDDNFAKDVSEFETLSALKADIKKKKLEEKEKQASIDAENKLVEEIVSQTKVDIPKCMINNQLDNFVEDIKQRLAYQGLKFEDYLKYTGQTLEDYKKTREAEAEKSVRTSLTLSKIIETEKITAEEKDIDAKLQEIADYTHKTLEEVKKTMVGNQSEFITNNVLTEKLMATLKNLNTIE
ncbi:MAG: trigger factor [Clostridia bacterium]|nr:trigger factor [Clostridia bacterium]